MSPQENQLLQDFLNQLVQVRGIARDPEADALINQAVARQPDAAYLLVQRALIQEHALQNAQAQIASLQQEIGTLRQGAGSASPSFLDAANAWGNSARGASLNAYGNPIPAASAASVASGMSAPMSASAAPQAAYPAAALARPSLFGGGSFLGNMAATAAGVAGGAFLFQGIENLMGHHNSPDMGGAHGMADVPSQSNSIGNGIGQGNELAASAGVNDIGPEDGSVDSAADDFLSDAGGGDDDSSVI